MEFLSISIYILLFRFDVLHFSQLNQLLCVIAILLEQPSVNLYHPNQNRVEFHNLLVFQTYFPFFITLKNTTHKKRNKSN